VGSTQPQNRSKNYGETCCSRESTSDSSFAESTA